MSAVNRKTRSQRGRYSTWADRCTPPGRVMAAWRPESLVAETWRCGGREGGVQPPDLTDLPSPFPLDSSSPPPSHRRLWHIPPHLTLRRPGQTWPGSRGGRVDCGEGPLRKRICSVNLGPAVTVTEEQGTKDLIPARLGLATSNTTCIYRTDAFFRELCSRPLE